MAAPIKEKKTFEENKKVEEVKIDLLNQCNRCGIRGGRYRHKETGELVGIFLYADARGFKICNVCREAGFFIGKQKLNKSDRRAQKKLMRELMGAKDIKHITLDSEGHQIV